MLCYIVRGCALRHSEESFELAQDKLRDEEAPDLRTKREILRFAQNDKLTFLDSPRPISFTTLCRYMFAFSFS